MSSAACATESVKVNPLTSAKIYGLQAYLSKIPSVFWQGDLTDIYSPLQEIRCGNPSSCFFTAQSAG